MSKKNSERLPKIPELLKRKLYKTGQTRGADDDQIYQNRVSRCSTVLIPFNSYRFHVIERNWAQVFQKGFIVLIPPDIYFGMQNPKSDLEKLKLELGTNALVFYETREAWNRFPPDDFRWVPAVSRTAPLQGQYVARIPATTSANDGLRISKGFTTTHRKGAGIRVYEYADLETIHSCIVQLEALFWLCADSIETATRNGMDRKDAVTRKETILRMASESGLLNIDRLQSTRVLNQNERAICPLCLEELSSQGFFARLVQAPGREVLDLTVTELNLFHIDELRMGSCNHCPYNLGWGHHHCNVVCKDWGIDKTLRWLQTIIQRNQAGGYFEKIDS